MKRNLLYIFFLLLLNLIACQKGIHWEFDSEGSLLKDSAGKCMPVSVAGTFTQNKPANDSNFVTVSVDVTAAGNYSITTDSVNGFIFKASGVFNNVGVAMVKLLCSGTPSTSGINHFSIHYNSSVCEADVTVLSDTIPAADYTLQGSPNTCMNDTVKGIYLPAVLLDTSNEVIISVNVITPGKYSISTNTVNGYNFLGEGVFTTTGVQSVIIKGSGSPVSEGNDVFTVKANNNTCSFSIKISSVVQTTNPLHFPLTAGSYWTYADLTSYDTIKRYVNGDTIVSSTNYTRITGVSKQNAFGQQDYFYNYTPGDYNQFQIIGSNYYELNFSPKIYGLMPILKEYCKPGDTWKSDEFAGKVPSVGDNRTFYYQCTFSCISNNAVKQVNGFVFKDVIVIAVYPLVKVDPLNPGGSIYVFGGFDNIFYSYYAKGVGLICTEESDDNGDTVYPVLQILDWKVN